MNIGISHDEDGEEIYEREREKGQRGIEKKVRSTRKIAWLATAAKCQLIYVTTIVVI